MTVDTASCFAVFGDPVAHSKSPAMHNAAFEVLGVPHRYHAFRVRATELPAAIAGARAMGLGGVNLTVPHKQAALALVDHHAPEVRRLGAINTLVRRETGLWGHSTDGAGFLAALGEIERPPPSAAVVLGGGGAARAIVDALLHRGDSCQVYWVSRHTSELPAWPGVERHGYAALPRLCERAELLVNATSVGMQGGASNFPVEIPLAALPSAAMVIDIVYPRPPRGLLARAEGLGLAVQDGLPMLLWQGVRAQELWRGEALPAVAIKAMRAALLP